MELIREDEQRYTCKYCGTEIPYQGRNENRGEIWICEECGEPFCEACFREKSGNEEWMKNVNDEEIIKCFDCYERKKNDL